MKQFLKDNWFKISFLVVTLITVIVIASIFYNIQVDKQNSIERQQQLELKIKTEQSNKEYAASQKKACMDIYETESKKYNNVKSWYYNEIDDECQITYNTPNKKTKSQCEEDYASCKKTLSEGSTYCLTEEFRCIDGVFVKAF
jgi:regulatory protein YycI of two-component signal transduction system YycFG